MAITSVARGAPTLQNLGTMKDTGKMNHHSRADAATARDVKMMGARDTVHIPVPEDGVLQEQSTVFAGSSAQAASVARGRAALQQQQPRSGLLALLPCSCFGARPSADADDSDSRAASAVPSSMAGGAAAPAQQYGGAPRSLGAGPSGAAVSRKLSRRTSSARKWVSLKRMGSSAYSDADWFDALSTVGSDDHHAMLAEVDAMSKELAPPTGPWVPDPPLAFAVPNMQFVPITGNLGLGGWWEKDDDRTTPPPLPIDVMLKASWIVQKSHNSVPGVFVSGRPTGPRRCCLDTCCADSCCRELPRHLPAACVCRLPLNCSLPAPHVGSSEQDVVARASRYQVLLHPAACLLSLLLSRGSLRPSRGTTNSQLTRMDNKQPLTCRFPPLSNFCLARAHDCQALAAAV
eukprot:GHRQ01019186.1.p1 GENE.GHRQ01019186.1~~GHRQ01019186.1.p1  ORF type:complete len:404 (+),score=121.68 GHRQ01019186.1:754-1965(+)